MSEEPWKGEPQEEVSRPQDEFMDVLNIISSETLAVPQVKKSLDIRNK